MYYYIGIPKFKRQVMFDWRATFTASLYLGQIVSTITFLSARTFFTCTCGWFLFTFFLCVIQYKQLLPFFLCNAFFFNFTSLFLSFFIMKRRDSRLRRQLFYVRNFFFVDVLSNQALPAFKKKVDKIFFQKNSISRFQFLWESKRAVSCIFLLKKFNSEKLKN